MEAKAFIEKVIEPAYEAGKNHVGYNSFSFYRGTRADGYYKVFRFLKGGETNKFENFISQNEFTDITGPWKTQQEAVSRLGKTELEGWL